MAATSSLKMTWEAAESDAAVGGSTSAGRERLRVSSIPAGASHCEVTIRRRHPPFRGNETGCGDCGRTEVVVLVAPVSDGGVVDAAVCDGATAIVRRPPALGNGSIDLKVLKMRSDALGGGLRSSYECLAEDVLQLQLQVTSTSSGDVDVTPSGAESGHEDGSTAAVVASLKELTLSTVDVIGISRYSCIQTTW